MVASGWIIGFAQGAVAYLFRKEPVHKMMICGVAEELFNVIFCTFVSIGVILPSNFALAFMYYKIYQVILQSVSVNRLHNFEIVTFNITLESFMLQYLHCATVFTLWTLLQT